AAKSMPAAATSDRVLPALSDVVALPIASTPWLPEQRLDQLDRTRERDEVSARYDLELDAQPIARDAPLKLDREQSIVRARDRADRNRGPGGEVARILHRGAGLIVLVLRELLHDVLRNVVEKIDHVVERIGVSVALGL